MADLTRAIAEALDRRHHLNTADLAAHIAAALAPLIKARVREARVDALTDAADAWTQGAWASTPRHRDRVADRMAASQYAGDWLRERAEEVRRGE